MTKNQFFNRSLLLGQWYRNEISPNGKETIEYAQLSEDGSFEFTFITLGVNGEIKQQITELGDWGLVGDIHFTLTKNELIDGELLAADLNNPENYHAYQVIALDHNVFHYKHRVTNEEYMMRRVVDKAGHC